MYYSRCVLFSQAVFEIIFPGVRLLRRKTAKISRKPDDLFFFCPQLCGIIPLYRYRRRRANEKILVVDDDKNICELLRLYLVKEGYNVTMVHDGGAALAEFDKLHPDLVLLDVMMPVMDGWEVCRKLRAKDNTPIIMLTAKGETYDKVLGLELGADDYIVKPFDAKEVTARIKAVLRRSSAKEEENKGVYDFDNLHLDMNRYELKVKGKVVEAPPKELELLACLAGHPNRVYTRDQLLDEVWGFEYYGDSRTIDVHVKRLREKLEGASEQWSLKTVWGVGYKFEVRE